MDDPKPKSKDQRDTDPRDKAPRKKTPPQTMATMADSSMHSSCDDVTIPDYVELEHEIPTLPSGTVVGKYTIDKILGVGGMGAVYRATQNKPQRQVALKLIRPGVLSSKSIRRFDLEAEILGRLDHPNIAKIHEAGIDSESGSPYFAMEYVDGQELGEYVKDQNLNTRDRLELFAKLCDAIQHAHAKGIIHRDLKPANVLVGKNGEPKVLDFGVARATDANSSNATMQTNAGQLIGTLYYMSPEQAIGDTLNLDTRSDVYALGVVLFEILTGEIPYNLQDKAIHEAVRIIQDTKPTKLSKIDHTFKGDIDIIVGKALVKEKDRRYQSVADLSADIRRFLRNQPISARAPSTIYKTSKFVRRNTGLTVTAACILIVFSVGIGYAASLRNQRMETSRMMLDNILLTLNEMGVQNGRATDGASLAKRMLDMYSENGESMLSGDPDRLAVFYTDLGEAFLGYEHNKEALSSFVKVLSIRERTYQAPHSLIAAALHDVARAMFFLNDLPQAQVYYQRAREMRESLFDLNDPNAADLATTLDHLGSTNLKLKNLDAVLPLYQRAKNIRMTMFGPDSLEVAQSNNSIASYYTRQNQHQLAEPIFRELLTILRALPKDTPRPVWEARTLHSLGSTLIRLNEYNQAIEALNESLQLKQELLGNNTASVAQTQQTLAEAYFHSQNYPNAIIHANEAVRIRKLIGDQRFIQSATRVMEIINAKAADETSAADSG
ncbi:MAG: serine/threonine protein kinase [Phycisphaerales bacterium]|nr:serine/threonine protein kinase [Phycisphaerales bacterium]